MKKSVRQTDIARRSRVSPTTVSLVLREKPGIPAATRARVWNAANALGYRSPNKTASTSSTQNAPSNSTRHTTTLHTIGLIIKAIPDQIAAANPFYSYVVAGIEEACRRKRINLLYATLPVDQDNLPVELPRLLSEEQVDGLLFVGTFVDGTLQHALEKQSVPVVLVDAYSNFAYDSIVSANEPGAYTAVSYLIQRGHRHIGIVGGRAQAYPSLLERRAGYLRALAEHGIAETYLADCWVESALARRAAHDLLCKHSCITALFGCNDEVAIEAMRAASELGYRVPQDISVIGFDDIDLAQHVVPALTTMHVDKLGMGRMAVQLLKNRAQNPDAARVTAFIEPRLIERASVAECKHSVHSQAKSHNGFNTNG
jgi:LacI family transcriptional regulator